MDSMTKRFLVFVFVIGALMAIVTNPLSGFNSPPTIVSIGSVQTFTDTNQINQQITSNKNNPLINNTQKSSGLTNNNIVQTNNTLDSTTSNTTVCLNLFCQIQKDLIGVGNQFCIDIGGCVIFGGPTNFAQLLTTAEAAAGFNKTGKISQSAAIQIANGVAKSTYGVDNNPLISIVDNPITQAVTLAIIFVGLGVLAGTFGAGILAPTMMRVGIAVSLFYYINAQLSVFNGIPWFVYILFNAIIGVPTLIMLWDSFKGGVSS